MNLLFIIGMQKSGTSLFNRMLMHQDFICNPFLPEGKFFWGDDPQSSPVKKPCGVLFQKYNGEIGHHLDANDSSFEDRQLLIERINHANISEPILMNKNPNNSVRIQWLKAMFPECRIVAIYRNPISNIFSLSKKYINNKCNDLHEDGWWGTKPKNWKFLRSEDKIIQSSKQWVSVNNEIIRNRNHLHSIVNYDILCSEPVRVIKKTICSYDIKSEISPFPTIKNLNSEYLYGSRILSKNVELRKNKSFNISNLNEDIEIPALTQKQILVINEITRKTWFKLKSLEINCC